MAEQPARTIHIENPLAGRADLVDEGRSLFNQYCSHCHGPNAVQGNGRGICGGLTFAMEKRHRPFFTRPSSTGRLDTVACRFGRGS